MKTPHKRHNNGFTLIELLVVMAIIATLAAVGFSAGMKAINNAHKVEAQNTCTTIESGINRFYDEYGALPYVGSSAPTVDTGYRTSTSTKDGGNVKQLSSGIDIISVLLAKESTSAQSATMQNSKQVKYIDLQTAKGKAQSQGGPPKGGIAYASGAANAPESLNDPWGNSYAIFLDYDYSEDIVVPVPDSTSSGTSTTRVRGRHALCYTLGASQSERKVADIVKTW